jgi:hypothetical protein
MAPRISEEPMTLIDQHPLIEEILRTHQHVCGTDLAGYQGYRGHVYRMLNFCLALSPQDTDGVDKLAVAAAFHDLHVFESFDYLGPSAASAARFLRNSGRKQWLPEVAAMIGSHHKLTGYRDEFAGLVEPFRKADWIEMSFGLFRFGLPAAYVKQVRRAFPISAFYPRAVLGSAFRWIIRHPLNPAPYYPSRRKLADINKACSSTAEADR